MDNSNYYCFHTTNAHIRRLGVTLYCTPHERVGTFACYYQCQLVIPMGGLFSDRFSPPTHVNMENMNYNKYWPHQHVGEFYWDLTHEISQRLVSLYTIKFEICFRSLKIKWDSVQYKWEI
uniref:Uncharacterized protein n=1 Tax=Cacopsylla melanoneura TaxID=428564 RepID=A0A8D9DRD7_9HEMI